MDPFTIGAIGAGIGAAGNIFGGLWGANENEKATQKLLDRLKELQERIEREWQLPEQDRTPLTSEEYKILETYTPELAIFIQEDSPELLREVPTEAIQSREKVMNRLEEMSNEGQSATTRAAAERAELESSSANRGRINELMKGMANRGLSGSGQELIAGIRGGAELAQGQRQSALSREMEEDQRRFNALQGLGSLSSQVAQEEQNRNAANAQAFNQYKQRMTNRRQNYEDYRTGTLNQANMYNQQNRQNINNKNVDVRNQDSMFNKNRNDEFSRERTRAMNEKLKLQAGLGKEYAETEYGGARSSAGSTAGMIGAGGNLIGGALNMWGNYQAKNNPPNYSKNYMTPWEESNWYSSGGRSRSS